LEKVKPPLSQSQSESSSPLGGIDLNPSLMDLQIKRDGNGIPLPMRLQPVEVLDIEGFVPVIINVIPVSNVPLLLGFDLPQEDEQPVNAADAGYQHLMELSLVEKWRQKYHFVSTMEEEYTVA